MKLQVRVPASSANMGPGFDCLACALDAYAHICVETCASGLVITGCDPAYQNEQNLVYAACRAALLQDGAAMPGLRIAIDSAIPVARGLGSSAALYAAGSAAGFYFSRGRLDQDAVFALVCQLESHPDNAAAAVYGGLRASAALAGGAVSRPLAIHPCFRFLAIIPPEELSTAQSRAVLPAQVGRQDAVANIAHTALTMAALAAGDAQLLGQAMDDRLHQPYRYPLVAHSAAIRQLALASGADAFYLSGAGSTLMCVYSQADFPARLAQAMATPYPRHRLQPLQIDPHGLQMTAS